MRRRIAEAEETWSASTEARQRAAADEAARRRGGGTGGAASSNKTAGLALRRASRVIHAQALEAVMAIRSTRGLSPGGGGAPATIGEG